MSGDGRIINTYNQIDEGDVFIAYQPEGPLVNGRCWYVVGKGFKTDPDSPWYAHGHKSFPLKGDGRGWRGDPALDEAKAWAGEHYGITNWRKNGLGDYIDADKEYPDLEMDVENARKTKEGMDRRARERRERRQKGRSGGPR